MHSSILPVFPSAIARGTVYRRSTFSLLVSLSLCLRDTMLSYTSHLEAVFYPLSPPAGLSPVFCVPAGVFSVLSLPAGLPLILVAPIPSGLPLSSRRRAHHARGGQGVRAANPPPELLPPGSIHYRDATLPPWVLPPPTRQLPICNSQ